MLLSVDHLVTLFRSSFLQDGDVDTVDDMFAQASVVCKTTGSGSFGGALKVIDVYEEKYWSQDGILWDTT